jgi:two-component system, sensor histidine kinase YesM
MKKGRQLAHHFFYNVSFIKKMVFLFCIGVVIPMIFLQAVSYLETERGIKERMLKTVNEALDDKTLKIRSVLSETAALEKRYSTNETLYQCLDTNYTKDLDYLIQYQETFQVLFSDMNLYPYHIRNIRLYTDNPTLMNGAYVRKTEDMALESLGETLDYVNVYPLAGERNTYIRTSHETRRIAGTSDSRSLSVIRVFDHYRQYNTYQKLIRVDVECEDLLEILRETNLFDNLILMDENGQVIAALNQYSNSGSMDSFDEKQIKNNGQTLLSRELSDFGLTLYGIYDMNSISQEFQSSRIQSIFLAAISILFALGCVYLVAGNISKRLNRLVVQADEIAQGHFVKKVGQNTAQDEFGVLEKSMDRMSAQLEELIEREYKAQVQHAQLERETNQARFLALQSQVNPHFMFNALESIRLKARVKGETETAQMIKYMAKMFRNLIEWDDNIITVREEIVFLDEFLHIQEYRFEDEFSYEIQVQEEAYECKLPKMILQPLVENACVHGLEAIEDKRWVGIDVSVDFTKNKLSLRVEDNGGGMTSEKLAQLTASFQEADSKGKSVGLKNVYRRLALYYGDQMTFEIESVVGKGTICRISIPL